ncbi:hypothetical protein A3A39_04455 [Candidatus Kaiserbacteria bacterium RIFCSPLOWO2_01_FULL_54_13]|uniref:tRNA-binding domain-containing protein n=1 Tax=Candidatus Kaiserbacteria bacterium RIFCSPLOWO2_01_FULL_54_13 TaxID=1798512 RepID=A0A1F6F1N5_9BACT|nr:MAG: hypothetical protein A3A39_04455 [Candidatus Kaiserbacteria bacterium RIFCSPLOWO2_01_FULL_54_13]
MLEENLTYEDFAKLDIRIGTVVAAEMVPEADKLIKCTVDFGDLSAGGLGMRTIVSGVAQWKQPEELVGRQFPYVVNLAPRILRGIKSEGMLLAASPPAGEAGDESGVALLSPERSLPPGTKLR